MKRTYYWGLRGLLVVGVILALMIPQMGVSAIEYEVTPGVDFEQDHSSSQKINVMELDLTKQHLDLELGMTENSSVLKLTEMARQLSEPGHRVVGGVNAGFFYMDFKRPTYLISLDGKLLNLGTVADSSGYMQIPTAFGMTNDKRGIIDTFDLNIEFSANGRSYSIDKYNGERGASESVLYTPSNYHYTPGTNKWGVEVYVENVSKNIDGNEMELGETVTGTVAHIRPYMSDDITNIPSDGYVISVHGESNIADGLEVGDQVELTLDIENQWKDTQFVLGSGPMLVENGDVASDMIPSNAVATTRAPRTAVGVNEDGSKVYLITVDGRQSGYSNGMTLFEFARYLENLGIYHALNLDGGGSTTMVAREYGNVYPSLMNQPSGGAQRAVINGLFAVVNQESGIPEKIGVERLEEGKVVIESGFDFNVNYVLDEYYHPVDFTDDELSYSVEGGIGRVEGQTFIAEHEGTGSIVVSMGQAEAEIPVEVIQAPDEVEVAPGDLQVAFNEAVKFSVDGRMSDGSNVIWNPKTTDWSVTSGVGAINDNGEFVASTEQATGEVVATINGLEYKSNITVGGEDFVVDSFEGNLTWSSRAGVAELDVTSKKAAKGSRSLKLTYDFSQSNIARVNYNGSMIQHQPDEIGLWLHGNVDGHELGLQVTDQNGSLYQLDLEEQYHWNGWRYVKAQVPDSLASPFSIDQLFIEKGSGNDKGVLLVDELALSFDGKNQSFYDLDHVEVVKPTKEWKITFDQPIDENSVNEDSIYVEDVSGEKHPVTYEFNDNGTVITVKSTGYQKWKHYRLVINEKVLGENGYPKLGVTDKIFRVE